MPLKMLFSLFTTFGNMMKFLGKVVLITGGSRGIGAATVRTVVANGGAAVIHYGSNRTAAEQLAAEVGPDKCHLIQADLAEPGAATALWAAALAWKGQLNALINNAGVFLEEDALAPMTHGVMFGPAPCRST
jgi:NAD(P)-dependent dehydrogenase (short-subunit alcohol dehydrogenase family)